MSFYAIGKAEKNLIIVELQFTGKLFGFPKDMKKKDNLSFRSWQNGANKIMQQ